MKNNSIIHLRALEPSDVGLLYQIENDQSLWQYGSNTMPFSREALSLYIATCGSDIYQDRQLRLVVEVGGIAVGLVDIFNMDLKHQRAEVGIVIMDEHRRKGYGSQALQAIVQLVLNHIALHQLYAYVGANNDAAKQVFLNAGFSQSGIIKDWMSEPHRGYADAVLFQYVY